MSSDSYSSERHNSFQHRGYELTLPLAYYILSTASSFNTFIIFPIRQHIELVQCTLFTKSRDASNPTMVRSETLKSLINLLKSPGSTCFRLKIAVYSRDVLLLRVGDKCFKIVKLLRSKFRGAWGFQVSDYDDIIYIPSKQYRECDKINLHE